MRVLLLSDRSFAMREHAMLRRLEIGLIDEGIRVVRASPVDTFPEPSTGLAGELYYNDRAWRYIMPAPERTLARDLEALPLIARPDTDEDPELSIDLIHAFGDKVAAVALDLAQTLECAVFIEVWSAALCAKMASIEQQHRRLDQSALGAVWLAPDDAMLDAARRSANRWPVLPSSWGVHAPSGQRQSRPENAPLSFGVLSSGFDPQGLMAFLGGLARAVTKNESILVFLDAKGVDRHPFVWRRVGELGLYDRLSIIADMESRRELILDVDVLVQPESRGEHRTVILEAMASQVVVLARADPLVECLHAPQAVTVLDHSPESWEHTLRNLLANIESLQSIGAAASAYARECCSAHRQVAATLNAYRTLCVSPALTIQTGQTSAGS